LPSEPVWISADDAIWINQRILAETSEPHRLSDRALLESAIHRPRDRSRIGEETDVLRLAASLLYGLAKNHPFDQGNKRTATVAALMFLEANGYEWTLLDDGELAVWVLEMVRDDLSEEGLAERMRPHLRGPAQ
jgi:death-on-curing protein